MLNELSPRPLRTRVEDEPGQGYFVGTVVSPDTDSYQYPIPALAFPGKPDEYVQDRFNAGMPVVAFRCGPRGMCEVHVNPDFYVTKRIETGKYPYPGPHTTDSDAYKTTWIEPVANNAPHFIELEGLWKGVPMTKRIEFNPANVPSSVI